MLIGRPDVGNVSVRFEGVGDEESESIAPLEASVEVWMSV